MSTTARKSKAHGNLVLERQNIEIGGCDLRLHEKRRGFLVEAGRVEREARGICLVAVPAPKVESIARRQSDIRAFAGGTAIRRARGGGAAAGDLRQQGRACRTRRALRLIDPRKRLRDVEILRQRHLHQQREFRIAEGGPPFGAHRRTGGLRAAPALRCACLGTLIVRRHGAGGKGKRCGKKDGVTKMCFHFSIPMRARQPGRAAPPCAPADSRIRAPSAPRN